MLPLAYSVSRAGGARPVLSSHFLSVGNRAVSSLSSSRADGLLAACLRHMINCRLRGRGKFQTYFKRGTECTFLPEGQCIFPSRVSLSLVHGFPADVEGSSIHRVKEAQAVKVGATGEFVSALLGLSKVFPSCQC